jgi:hypothetical protein
MCVCVCVFLNLVLTRSKWRGAYEKVLRSRDFLAYSIHRDPL